jgi:hypothetical protein
MTEWQQRPRISAETVELALRSADQLLAKHIAAIKKSVRLTLRQNQP